MRRRGDVLPIDVAQLEDDLFWGAVEAARRASLDRRAKPAVTVVQAYIQTGTVDADRA